MTQRTASRTDAAAHSGNEQCRPTSCTDEGWDAEDEGQEGDDEAALVCSLQVSLPCGLGRIHIRAVTNCTSTSTLHQRGICDGRERERDEQAGKRQQLRAVGVQPGRRPARYGSVV